jgi:4-hydroxy-2-oxoglutarate aldolase
MPILIYSWPLVTSGIEVNSDMMSTLGQHPNIVGTKLTCGGIGKAVRIAGQFKQDEFCFLAGFTDWLLPALFVGGAGAISGFANLCPRVCFITISNLILYLLRHQLTYIQSCMKIYRDYQEGKIEEAKALQYTLAEAEWKLTLSGINGTKWTVAKLLEYNLASSATRKPYPEFGNTEAQNDVLTAMEKIWAQEESLKQV